MHDLNKIACSLWGILAGLIPEGVFLLLDSVDEGSMEDGIAGAPQGGAAVRGAVLPWLHQPIGFCNHML